MKNLIVKLIPKALLPFARNIYAKITALLKNTTIVQNSYDFNSPLQYTKGQNKYGQYCVPNSSIDRLASQKILSGEIYEPDTIEYMTSHCGDGDIVHAGTFFGDFLPALSSACSEKATIWAFEPNPENYRCANETVLMNKLDNVELKHAGLGKKNESLTMMTSDENGNALGGRSRLIDTERNRDSGGVETVQILSIDEVVPENRNVSIIQLDVEGHEQHALTGALKTVQRSLPIIILEAYSDGLFESEWFIDNFSRLGYKIDKRVHNNTILISDQVHKIH